MQTSETQRTPVPNPYGLAVLYPDSLYWTFLSAETTADTAVLHGQVLSASHLCEHLIRKRIDSIRRFQVHIVALFPVEYLGYSPVDVDLSLFVLPCHLFRIGQVKGHRPVIGHFNIVSRTQPYPLFFQQSASLLTAAPGRRSISRNHKDVVSAASF